MVKWGGQEVRTSVKRDSGKECSWPKEELALIVRTKKQLQEPVEVEVSRHPRRGGLADRTRLAVYAGHDRSTKEARTALGMRYASKRTSLSTQWNPDPAGVER